jgi:hypothetical protein
LGTRGWGEVWGGIAHLRSGEVWGQVRLRRSIGDVRFEVVRFGEVRFGEVRWGVVWGREVEVRFEVVRWGHCIVVSSGMLNDAERVWKMVSSFGVNSYNLLSLVGFHRVGYRLHRSYQFGSWVVRVGIWCLVASWYIRWYMNDNIVDKFLRFARVFRRVRGCAMFLVSGSEM